MVPLKNILKRVERFEKREDFREYTFAGTYSFARGIFVGETKKGSSFSLAQIQRIHAGDFIYCKIMAWEGAFGIAPEATHDCVMSGAFVAYEINLEIIEPGYLEYYFKVPEVWRKIGSKSTGTNVRRRSLHPNQFEAEIIPLPTILEQRRIVARIEELAAKIEEARGLRESAIVESQSLVTSLHLNLSGSRTVELNQILTLDERQEEVIFGKEFPQVGVKGFGGGLFAKESVNSTQTTYRAFNRLYDGALVLSQVKGWEGAIAVCPPSLLGKYVSPEYRTFSCRPGFAIPEYLASLVVTPWFWKQLKDLTRGMGGRRERTRPEQFLRMKLPMPIIGQQKYAVSVFERVNLMRVRRDEALRKMEGLLPTILDKAFKGEL